jgi:hypothetical protein
LIGEQVIAKFNRNEFNRVKIALCVFRIPTVQSDILITVNAPVDTALPLTLSIHEFEQMVATFRINDWSLFG